MTCRRDRPNTALLVVDVQNDVVANAHRRDEVITNIATLIDRARARRVPVIWVQHSDDDLREHSEGWQYVAELEREPSDARRSTAPSPAAMTRSWSPTRTPPRISPRTACHRSTR